MLFGGEKTSTQLWDWYEKPHWITTSKVVYIFWDITMSAADYICMFFQCHSTTTLWSITAEANTYSHSVLWTRELTHSTVMARQTDHRNQQKVLLPAFCLYAWKEKSSELSIILSEGRGRPTSCPGQHDAPVQKLNARPALPSSSPTVDFPPLYPTWASKPAQHTHTK